MTFFKFVFVVLGLIFVVNLFHAYIEIYLKSPVYACSEVTKQDPINVQQICKKAWRRYE